MAVPHTYLRLAAASLRARLQYPLSFALDFVMAILGSFAELLVIFVFFTHLPRLGGWSLPEVLLLYGIAGVAFGISDLLVGNLDHLEEMIRRGTFDVFLIRPLAPLFLAVAVEFPARRLGGLMQAGAALALALVTLPVQWTPARALIVVMAIASGTAIFAAVWVASTSICFWTTQITEATNALTYGGSFLTAYPINIFGEWLRRFLAFVVPLAFVAYYPSLLLLDRPDPLGGPAWLGLLSPPIALLATLVARTTWGLGIRNYRSTGS